MKFGSVVLHMKKVVEQSEFRGNRFSDNHTSFQNVLGPFGWDSR